MSHIPAPKLQALNENTIRIDFSSAPPSPELCLSIAQLREQICKHFPNRVYDVIASYNALLVYYDFLHAQPQELINKITQLWDTSTSSSHPPTPVIHKIPVYYGPEAGLDIPLIAEAHNIKNSDVIRKHCEKNYMIYALGFAPGFAYMGFVDNDIRMPRHASPRKHVPKGAVGIAGGQTGIYPLASPGGWNIIGLTPTSLIDLEQPPQKPFLSVGECVKFFPITKEEFLEQGGEL